MAVSELPVSITEPKPHTSYDYFAHKYEHKTVVQFKEDLKAIDTSLRTMGSPKLRRKQRRHKKAKFPSMSIVPNLQDINESEETNSFDGEKIKKDLATIHKERAITSGNFIKQEGRSFRHKRFHKSSSKD
jgi:hypothetical protein